MSGYTFRIIPQNIRCLIGIERVSLDKVRRDITEGKRLIRACYSPTLKPNITYFVVELRHKILTQLNQNTASPWYSCYNSLTRKIKGDWVPHLKKINSCYSIFLCINQCAIVTQSKHGYNRT
jgi:hypothetical protein